MDAPAPASDFVEIPGFREVLRRERDLREQAFAPDIAPRTICGVEVVPLTLERLILLERVRCAFVVPFKFETGEEVAVEAMRFVWLISAGYDAPRGRWHGWVLRWRRARLMRTLLRAPAGELLDAIRIYLDEMFYDAPKATKDAKPSRSFAHWVALLVDELTAANYRWSEAELMAMPVPRLWQYVRIAGKRLRPEYPLLNPSDVWAGEEFNRITEGGTKLPAKA